MQWWKSPKIEEGEEMGRNDQNHLKLRKEKGRGRND